MPQTLLIDDAAQLMGVSRRTVYYRIREGRLVTIRTKCGSQRVLVSSIRRLLREIAGVPVSDESFADELYVTNPAMGSGG